MGHWFFRGPILGRKQISLRGPILGRKQISPCDLRHINVMVPKWAMVLSRDLSALNIETCKLGNLGSCVFLGRFLALKHNLHEDQPFW